MLELGKRVFKYACANGEHIDPEIRHDFPLWGTNACTKEELNQKYPQLPVFYLEKE